MYVIDAYNLDGTGGVLYDPDHIADERRIVYDISSVEKELGKAGSFSFTVPKENPLYDSIYRLGTKISLYKKPGNLLWTGRILSMSKDLYCNKIIRCEGALCYLNDIIVRPYIYKNGSGHSFAVSPVSHYGELGRQYNGRCSEGRELSFSTNLDESDVMSKIGPYGFYGVTDYITVREAIDSILDLDDDVSINIRYAGSSYVLELARIPFHTLDVSESGVGIDITVNMINYTDEFSEDDICTAIVPLGENNRVLYDTESEISSDSFTSTNLVNKYGKIEKVMRFDSANNDTKLKQSALLALRALEREDQPTITLNAVDLFHLGKNSDMIDIGYEVPLYSPRHGMHSVGKYVCTSCSVNIESLDQSSYTFKRM